MTNWKMPDGAERLEWYTKLSKWHVCWKMINKSFCILFFVWTSQTSSASSSLSSRSHFKRNKFRNSRTERLATFISLLVPKIIMKKHLHVVVTDDDRSERILHSAFVAFSWSLVCLCERFVKCAFCGNETFFSIWQSTYAVQSVWRVVESSSS